MTITVTRQSPDFDKLKIDGQYVRYDPADNTYRWCQTAKIGRGGKQRILDVAVGICDEADLPADVAAAARKACVISPPYVDWPL